MTFTVSVSGLAELDKALGELPKATARNVLKRTLDKAAQPIVEAAKMYAPVNTGKLRDSIIASARVKNKVGNAEYSAAMRAGLGKAAAGAALRQARRDSKGLGSFAEIFVGPSTGTIPYAHIVEFGSVKDSPQPYMRPAWDGQKQKALEIIKAELGSEIIKAARRVGRSKKQSAEVKYRASIAAMIAAGF
jgi:HK97 gp10 family phage protein